MLPVSIAAASTLNTTNTLFTHIYHCLTVNCFNGRFVSTFECRRGHVQASFGAAGAGGRGEADPRAAWETGPAEGAESNAGNIPGWCPQVSLQHAANTPTTSTPCVSLHRPRAPGMRSSQMSFTPAPGNHGLWVQQRKKQYRPQTTTSPLPPPSLFEISSRNHFVPLRERGRCDCLRLHRSARPCYISWR